MAILKKSEEIKRMDIKYLFTKEEKEEIADEMASQNIEKTRLENEKKTAGNCKDS